MLDFSAGALSPPGIAFVLATFVIAGTVKGTIGVGLPLVAMGILSTVISPKLAVALIAVPMLATNVMQFLRSGDIMPSLRRFWPLAVVMIATLWFATGLVPDLDPQVLFGVVGVAVLIFTVSNLAADLPRLPQRYEFPVGLVAGVASGGLGGLSTIWGPPLTMYFLAIRLEKNEYIRAAGMMWLAGTFPLVLGYIANGVLTATHAPLAVLACLPAALGFWIGERLRNRIPTEIFRRVLLWAFLIIGLNLIRRAVF